MSQSTGFESEPVATPAIRSGRIKEEPMMDVSTNATVQATDGVGGRVSRLLVNPGTNTVTQLVVELPDGAEVVVPADYVTDSNARRVRVNLTRQQLAGMTPYTPPARRRRQPSAFESLFSGSP